MVFSQAPIEQRRAKVAELLRHHYTEGQIARKLGAGLRTVSRDVVALREEWRSHRTIDTDAWVDAELDRLAVAERAVWPKVEKGDLWAIDRLLAIMDRRTRYLGLDAAPVREHDGSNAAPVSITIQPIDYRTIIAPILSADPGAADLAAGPEPYRLASSQYQSIGDGEALGEDGPGWEPRARGGTGGR